MLNIAPGKATAEQESNDEVTFLKNFLPIPNYRFVLEPNIFLIVGGRGVGKTELFRLLALSSGRKALVENLSIRALPELGKTTWIAGFGRTRQADKRFPTPEDVEQQMRDKSNIEWRSFWIGLILGIILQEENFNQSSFICKQLEALDNSIIEVLKNQLPLLSRWYPWVNENRENLNFLLDKLDENLIKADEWLFISYDELDRIVPSYRMLSDPIRELLAFWLDRSRRWERIRSKIFLRTDLSGQDFLNFPDASKLKGHQVNLEWQHRWLYQLLIKRLANSDDEMKNYLQEIPELIIDNQSSLGWMPRLDETLFEKLIEKMISKYMGATPRKGVTYRWIPNHLQDADGRIAPRSFLKLFALASRRRIGQSPIGEDRQLLYPSNLQEALMETSEERIKELTEEEYPWLSSLKPSLDGLKVPMEKEQFLEKALKRALQSDHQGRVLPADTPEGILQLLCELGIVEIRSSDDRINIPEIYLYGFGVKRQGGVKRPK
jgi:predicted transcriptional regulator